MSIIQKKITVSGVSYFLMHLNIINALLGNRLSNKEVEVLASVMSLDDKIIGIEPFNPYARKEVRKILSNMSPAGLSNHIRVMIKKGFLSKDEISGRIEIKKFLFPSETSQGYQIKIIKSNEA